MRLRPSVASSVDALLQPRTSAAAAAYATLQRRAPQEPGSLQFVASDVTSAAGYGGAYAGGYPGGGGAAGPRGDGAGGAQWWLPAMEQLRWRVKGAEGGAAGGAVGWRVQMLRPVDGLPVE
jgi:hypothetical protein